MDPSRDFVHIDEVFKKLHQTPYSETNASEAWSRMKGLLDEEMPLHPKSKPFVKRKYFYPLLLLVASATISGTVWGYKSLNASKAAVELANTGSNWKNQPDASKNLASNTAEKIKNTTVATTDNVALNVASLAHSVNEVERQSKINKPNAPKSLTQKGANSVKPLIATTDKTVQSANNNINTSNNTPNYNQDNNTNNALALPIIASNNNTNQTDNQPSVQSINSIKNSLIVAKQPTNTIASNTFTKPNWTLNNNSNKESDPSQNATVTNDKISSTIERTSNNNAASNDRTANKDLRQTVTTNEFTIEDQSTIAMQASLTNATVNDNIKIVNGIKFTKDENGQWYKETKRKIPIVKNIKKIDPITNEEYITTVGESSMFVINRLPADELEIVKITALDNIPSINNKVEINNFSALANKSSNYSNLKILNENKVKIINTTSATQNFNNNLKALRDDIARFFQNTDKLQAAINFGGLYTPSGTGGYGFNFGLSAVYLISERINLSIEARYVHKSFTNFYIDDVNRKYDVSQNGSIYNGTETITNQEYLIKGVSMFEVPLYLTYNIGERLSLFGGLQFAYAAPIKWSVNSNFRINENYANIDQPIDKAFRINEKNDFAAQTGFGYMFGVGFDVSKRMSLDFRVNQNFHSNGQIGASNSVNNIFTTPTFNINIGFWFGKTEKIYYLLKR